MKDAASKKKKKKKRTFYAAFSLAKDSGGSRDAARRCLLESGTREEEHKGRFQLAALIIACCQPLTTPETLITAGHSVHGTPAVREVAPYKHARMYTIRSECTGEVLINSGNQISGYEMTSRHNFLVAQI